MGYFSVMGNLLVRVATLDDLTVLKKFEQEIIRAERPFDPTIRPDPINYYDIGELIQSNDAHVVVAEVAERIVASGYAKIKTARHYLDHETYAYLGFMYTEPDSRGMGINSKIIQALLLWAESKKLNEVRLTVYQDNLQAIRAYEKTGFKSHLNEMRLRLEIEK